MIEKSIEELRTALDQLVASRETQLSEGPVLELSQEMDTLINLYYKLNK